MRRVARMGVTVAAVVAGVTGIVVLSPYGRHEGFDYKLLVESATLHVPCDAVFDYLGTSSNAREWSVFVSHITPLNPAEARDGAAGSIRRSFQRADETGMMWDEYFTDVRAGRERRLLIYNVRGATLRSDTPLMTAQIYDPLPAGCRLALTLFFESPPPLRDEIKMRLASYKIGRIFRRNIANIKRITEARFGDRPSSRSDQP